MVLFFNDKTPTIPEFFKNKNVLVTGGSGFLGRVLIEKLLRSCPDIGNIYVLLREKKGKTSQERVNDISDVPLFELLKKQNIDAIKKIIPINGDIGKLRLGLSNEDRNTIIDQVNVIFHGAATVRFNEPLKKAIFYNVRGTAEVARLAKEIKNLAVFAHISTAYCNSDKKVIEEKLYPAHVDWRKAIQLAEEIDETVLQVSTEKYIKPLVNTYTFTKSLAEHVVNDLCLGTIPVIIVRPTIVLCSINEPVPGWIDNLNGPFGMGLAASMGFLRISYADGKEQADHIFVDNFVKSLIVATWEKAIIDREKIGKTSIYNCTEFRVLNSVYVDTTVKIFRDVKMNNRIWSAVSSSYLTACYYYYFINVILFHMIPAILIDGFWKILGKRPYVIMLQRKVYLANTSMFFFMSTSFDFKRQNYLGLEDKLLQDDLSSFSFRSGDLDTPEELYLIFRTGLLGIKLYIMKESPDISRRTILIDESLRVLEKIIKLSVYGYMLYMVFWKFNFLAYLLEAIFNHFDKS